MLGHFLFDLNVLRLQFDGDVAAVDLVFNIPSIITSRGARRL